MATTFPCISFGIFLYFTGLQIALKVLLVFGHVEVNQMAWLGTNFRFFPKLPISKKGCDQKDVGDLTVTSTGEADYTLKHRNSLRTIFSTD